MAPTALALVRAMRSWLRSAADPRRRRDLGRVIPGALALGIGVPTLRAEAARLRATHRALPLAGVADVMDVLAARRVREELLLGTFWLARYGRALEALPWRRLAAWLPALDNWETCDQLAMNVAAPVVAANPALVRRLHRLTASRSAWVRRFALATASALNQKGRAHVGATLTVCGPLVADPSRDVRKAVGWALRAASRHDAAAVEAFLRAHAARAHRGVLREGAAKLPAARREAISRAAAPPARRPRRPAS